MVRSNGTKNRGVVAGVPPTVQGSSCLAAAFLEFRGAPVDKIVAILGMVTLMPRSRFMLLLRFLHVNSIDPSQVTINPNYERLYNVCKLLDIILPKYESAYTTH